MTNPADAPVLPAARVIYVANLVAQALIVVTGAVVRLTGSGLGCPTWPECVDGSITPTSEQVQAWHKYVEFGNRTLTFALVLLAVACLVMAWWDARRRRHLGAAPRPALLALATVPLLGTVAQAVIGGVTVLTGLNPAIVGAHFLVSMAIIAGCTALVVRSRDAGDTPIHWLVSTPVRVLSWLTIAATAAIVLLGVVVTGSGPHSGDTGVQSRLPLDPRTVAWLHADIAFAFLGLSIGLLVALLATKAPHRSARLLIALLAVAGLQVGVGYTQYFTGLPIVLVAVHVSLACVIWILALLVPGTLRERGSVRVPSARQVQERIDSDEQE